MLKIFSVMTSLIILLFPLTGCMGKSFFSQDDKGVTGTESDAKDGSSSVASEKKSEHRDGQVQEVFNPESIPVLVNQYNILPENYQPEDLVYPNIPYISNKKAEKQKMRKEAAAAIEKLFAAAEEQGIGLAGVSAYRSYTSQKALFNYYVNQDGIKKAKTYSAVPGTSEHETGLAIDVTGGNGKCPAEDCFAGTVEAKWLADHADEYGFIIRYPKGKESITGYKYEPWHLRYVGKAIAKAITKHGITLEEYYDAVPVNN
ncbi:M15 family metallopeptidase [Neobacillus rhizophilus]|nr:M15 family metallopeptidase [Neobacillus rhizophilus]